jgi:hypothetical protein
MGGPDGGRLGQCGLGRGTHNLGGGSPRGGVVVLVHRGNDLTVYDALCVTDDNGSIRVDV